MKEAKRARQAAYKERAAIEQRIVNLTKSIDGLSALCEPKSEEQFLVGSDSDPTLFQVISLTDAIRHIFSKSSEPVLTPTEVRDELLAMGMDLAKYKQPLVPIHNTLKRLVSQEELVEFRDDNNELRGYRWVTPLARAVAKVESRDSMPDYLKQHLRRNGLPFPRRSDND